MTVATVKRGVQLGKSLIAAMVLLAALVVCDRAHADACMAAPPVVRNLDIPRFYGDEAGTTLDPVLQRAHEAAVAPLNVFVRHVTQEADKALRRASLRGRQEIAGCTLDWLAAWARGGAWLGRMGTRQAEYQRKWDLAGVSVAYLKLKRFTSREQRETIEPWLQKFADTAHAFFDDPARQRNNHWYWLGLAQAAVGLATNSPRHWERARGIMADAAADVADDGTLAIELAREKRALFYHAFAVVPLVVMAELAASRGEDWYALGGGALHRLVQATHAGLNDPAIFDRRAAKAQERPVNARAGWLQLYLARFPDRLPAPHPIVGDGHRWIGGNALLLSDVLQGKRVP